LAGEMLRREVVAGRGCVSRQADFYFGRVTYLGDMYMLLYYEEESLIERIIIKNKE